MESAILISEGLHLKRANVDWPLRMWMHRGQTFGLRFRKCEQLWAASVIVFQTAKDLNKKAFGCEIKMTNGKVEHCFRGPVVTLVEANESEDEAAALVVTTDQIVTMRQDDISHESRKNGYDFKVKIMFRIMYDKDQQSD